TTINITDNETAPTITWSPVSSSASENGGSVQITATLSATSGLASSIAYTVGGTAINGSDYTLSDGTLTIAAGETTGTLTIIVGNDVTDENSETVYVRMVTYTNTTSESTANEYTLTITDDDDPPTISFSPSTSSIAESGGTISITATLSVASEKSISVSYNVTGGTASSSNDYTFNSGTLSFSAGSTSQTFTTTIIEDTIDEDSETIIFGLSSFSNVTIIAGSGANHTLTITDNDNPPTISWSPSTATVSESAGTFTITATLSSASSKDITAAYSISGGTATISTDYSLTTGTITITNGQTSTTISGTLVNDVTDESDETVGLEMTDFGNASGGTTTYTLTIADDDTAPTITSISDQTTTEDLETSEILFTVEDTDGDQITVVVLSGDTSLVPSSASNITLRSSSGGTTYSLLTVAGGENLTLTILPLTNQSGSVMITITATDGVTTPLTTESFMLTVTGINDAPTITSIIDQQVSEETATNELNFTVSDADSDVLAITVTTSNSTLVPSSAGNITLVSSNGTNT
ncbi:hypothetical protein MHK_009732, partial [Candidatus Magnetomorum sp. HK-1]